jgi:hypothetical protein
MKHRVSEGEGQGKSEREGAGDDKGEDSMIRLLLHTSISTQPHPRDMATMAI